MTDFKPWLLKICPPRAGVVMQFSVFGTQFLSTHLVVGSIMVYWVE